MRDYSSSPEPEVYTLHDLVHRLTLRTQSDASERNEALMMRAIQDAIRGLPGKRDWSYFTRQTRFETSPRITPEVVYDHTGGTHERLLTIMDVTNAWPSDAADGEIWIDDQEKTYRIHKRISGSKVTLQEGFSPTEDFEGDIYWGRRAYMFNREVTKVHDIRNVTQDRPIYYLPTSSFAETTHANWGVTEFCSWQNHGGWFGATEFVLYPHPVAKELIEVTATVNPLIPKVNLVSGTDAIVSGNTLTSASSTFSDKLVGCILRISYDTSAPTYYNSEGWEWQAFVTEVTDQNTLKLSESIPDDVSGRGFSLSSPADIEASVMLEYVEDEAYHQYTKNHNHKLFGQARQVAKESLILASARDRKTSLNGYAWAETYSNVWWLAGGFYTISSSSDDDSTSEDCDVLYAHEEEELESGSSVSWSLFGRGLARYATLTLDQDSTLNVSDIELGQYGNVKIIQDGTGGWSLEGGTDCEVVGKLDREPDAITNFSIQVTNDVGMLLISELTPKEGENDLGDASDNATVNFEWGTSDNKLVTLDEDWSPDLIADRVGAFKLRVVQDATGGWEITWPPNVKYNGVSPQANPAGLSETIFEAYYDGTYINI